MSDHYRAEAEEQDKPLFSQMQKLGICIFMSPFLGFIVAVMYQVVIKDGMVHAILGLAPEVLFGLGFYLFIRDRYRASS